MKSRTTGVQQFYDRVGTYFSHTRKWLWPEMLPYLTRLKPNDTVLDIGCGNGRLIQGFPVPVRYTGVDFSQLLLANARKLHPDRRFLAGNILDSATWDQLPTAEAIFNVAVLHHMQPREVELVIQQIAAKLEENGFAYVSVWNLWQKKYLKHHFSVKSLVTKLTMLDWRVVWIPFQNKSDRFCVAHTPKSLMRAAAKAKLTVETYFYSGTNSKLLGKNLVFVLTHRSLV